MSTQVLGSESFTVAPDVNGNPVMVSTSGSVPAITATAGAPSGTPATGTGTLYVDTTNYNLYIYNGTAWTLIGYDNIIQSISTATAAGNTINIQYTYLVSGNTTLTLPTAIGNLNTYTVKNVDGNTTTIATTSSQTIDGSTSAVIRVKYTALTLISDGANWNII